MRERVSAGLFTLIYCFQFLLFRWNHSGWAGWGSLVYILLLCELHASNNNSRSINNTRLYSQCSLQLVTPQTTTTATIIIIDNNESAKFQKRERVSEREKERHQKLQRPRLPAYRLPFIIRNTEANKWSDERFIDPRGAQSAPFTPLHVP